MQGFVFCELQDYVQRTLGFPVWEEIATKLHVENKNYNLFESYSDQEFHNLLMAVAEKKGYGYEEILIYFGEFLAPKLWRISKRMIPSKWDLLDLLENLTGFTQNLLAHAISGSEAPPIMRCLRTKPDEVTIFYVSPRKMCGMGKGIIKGLSVMYDCDVKITEPSCMLRGDDQCKMIFQVTKRSDTTPQ